MSAAASETVRSIRFGRVSGDGAEPQDRSCRSVAGCHRWLASTRGKRAIRRHLDAQAGAVVTLDAVHVPDLALGVDRPVERAHGRADLDSDPTVVPLAEAHRLVVGARSGPLLDPAGAPLPCSLSLPASSGQPTRSLTIGIRASTPWLSYVAYVRDRSVWRSADTRTVAVTARGPSLARRLVGRGTGGGRYRVPRRCPPGRRTRVAAGRGCLGPVRR